MMIRGYVITMYCIKCGKQIPDGVLFCPDCGAPQSTSESSSNNGSGQSGYSQPGSNQPGYFIPPQTMKVASYNTMCIVGLVVSGISLFINFFGLVGITGIILSVIGLNQCKKMNENGKMLAVVGIILGAFSTFYGFIALLSFMAMF